MGRSVTAPEVPNIDCRSNAERLPLGTKISYGLPNIAGAGMGIAVGIHVNIYYADAVLLPLGFIAAAVAAARSIDAITDPLMGWISDRTRTRWGRRRPWMFVSAPLAAIALVALFSPPEGMETQAAAVWFAVSFVSFFLFVTMYQIPHYGLGPEITSNYKERSSLFAWLEGASLLGIICASYVPLQLAKDSMLGPRDGFQVFAVGFALLLVAFYWSLCVRVRERPAYSQGKSNPLIPGIRRTMRNRPFRLLLISYLIGATTAGISGLLWPFFATYVLKIGPGAQGILLASIFVWGFVSLPLWVRSTRRWGKKWNYIGARVAGAVSAIGMFFMREGDLVPAAILLALAGIAYGGYSMLGPSIQADVIDYDELHTGKRREAQYGSLWAIMIKFVQIPGAAIPLGIIASFGYVSNADQTETVQLVIMLLYSLAPASAALLSVGVFILFPINERTHLAVLEGIGKHKRGESAIDPLTGELLAPPDKKEIDEDTGWFLDHFSKVELSRVLRQGRKALLLSTVLSSAASLAIMVMATWFALEGLGDMSVRPGVVVVLQILLSGLALTGFVYHAVRVSAARRMSARHVSNEDIRVHLRA
ncbi:MAG: MFS transporter [Pseudomonadales bacterium]|nr:MFS transporter [Pseudomonadales bacterium]MDP6473263.1 MFS transporter [Pseudomonadales bacterium]MDP6829188.1 MFS transporter [Pseudomonadales bacterium]